MRYVETVIYSAIYIFVSFCVIMHDAFRFFKIYLVYIHLGTVLGVWLQNFSLRVSHCLNYPSYWLIAEGSMILANIWRRFSLSLSLLFILDSAQWKFCSTWTEKPGFFILWYLEPYVLLDYILSYISFYPKSICIFFTFLLSSLVLSFEYFY